MVKYTTKELLEWKSTSRSKLRLKNLLFVSDEIMSVTDLGRLMVEGVSEGFHFEMRGRGISCDDFQGKSGYVDSDLVSPQSVPLKRSRGADDERGSLSKRRRTSESYKKKDSVSTVDSENLSGRASVIRAQDKTISNGRSETEKQRLDKRKTDFEVEIRVTEKVRENKVLYKSRLSSKKICEGVASELPNKAIGTGSLLSHPQPVKAFTASKVDSDESARKALRAAMIKTRFADTILKAQEQKFISQGNKVEKERLKETKKAEIEAAETKLKPKTSEVVELANKTTGIGSIPSDSQPKAITVSNIDSENPTRKVSRSEMIKTRFAHTILKAQEQKILSQGSKAEKKRFEERKADTEAEIKAAERKMKEQRQKEREAAQHAVEKMGRTVEWNCALQFEQEIENLMGSQYEVDKTEFCRDKFEW